MFKNLQMTINLDSRQNDEVGNLSILRGGISNKNIYYLYYNFYFYIAFFSVLLFFWLLFSMRMPKSLLQIKTPYLFPYTGFRC